MSDDLKGQEMRNAAEVPPMEWALNDGVQYTRFGYVAPTPSASRASSRPLTHVPLSLLIAALFLVPAKAEPRVPASSHPVIDEIRLGVLATDLEPGGGSNDEGAVNAEILTAHLGRAESNAIFDRLLHPRVHLGTTLNFDDDGVNQAYVGLTWDYRFNGRLFVETSFGGAVHDGKTGDDNTDSYGCTLQFRESLSVGINLSERLSVMATIDHMSNAGLCDENQGLTNAGLRFGYRW